jgi:N-acetyltransferase
VFDPQPVLEGSLLELRPLRDDDFDALYAAASDPLIWEQHPERDRWRLDVFTTYFSEQRASGGALLVLDARTGEAIGLSRYHGYDAARSEVEIGWTFLVRRCWGGVYNRELKDLMLGHAFCSVRSVVFLVAPDNIRSRRSVEKLGAVEMGERVGAYGQPSVVYQLAADAYDRAPTVEGGAMDHAATIRQAYELISAGDLEGFGALIADDMVEHEAAPGLAPTKEGVLQFFTMYRAGFPDLKMEPEQVFVNDDTAAVYYRATGTHSGEFMGIAPTGKSFDVHGVDIVRFGEEGLAREHWGVFDTFGMMQQLGVVEGPPA